MIQFIRPIVAVTQHALDRYMERSGCTNVNKAIKNLTDVGERGIPIGRQQFYAKGWIVVVRRFMVVTAFKPKTFSQQNRVNRAVGAKNAQTQLTPNSK